MAWYLVAAFGTCIVALGALMALTTASSFARERNRASIELKAAAQVNADSAAVSMSEMVQFLEPIARQPELETLDPAQCHASLGSLAAILSAPSVGGHIEVYRQDGSLVCSVPSLGDHAAEGPKGTWFDEVLVTHQPVDGGVGIDPLTGQPSSLLGLPINAASGETGVMAVSVATGGTPMALPAGAPPQMVLVELDPSRRIVLAASANAPVKVGRLAGGSMSQSAARGVHTVEDADGVTRLYAEVTTSRGWHVRAGVPKTIALAPAQSELHRNLQLGLAILLLVIGLGFLLGRRLARPMRRLRLAIEAAKTDNTVRAPVAGPSEIAAVAEAFNVTIEERQQLEIQLSHQALHDPLTGLANRTLLADRLEVALSRRRTKDQTHLAVLFFDLDRFKVINDSYGHARGDEVLMAVAQRLQGELREGDTVARFGGDEFVVVAENVTSDADLLDIAMRLQDAIRLPLKLNGSEAHITATVGVALAGAGSTAGGLLRDADAAMYRGKEIGRGGVEIFDEQLGAQARKRADTEAALRRGLSRGEFVVHYQPEVEVATGRMVGVEALVRWNRPRLGMVPPLEFIPIAEETGLILELGDFVLEQACRQQVAWANDGLALTMSVNLAPRQLIDPDLPARVKAILARTGASATDLIFEMTESALVEDDPRTMAVLGALKVMGVRLALDDFGTGYASLSYLRHFPVDVVKVDRSFVSDLAKGDGGGAIVAAVLAMGCSLGLLTVAEGVEQQSQLGVLDQMGCTLAQGFYLAKPQDPEGIPALAGHDLRTPQGVSSTSPTARAAAGSLGGERATAKSST